MWDGVRRRPSTRDDKKNLSPNKFLGRLIRSALLSLERDASWWNSRSAAQGGRHPQPEDEGDENAGLFLTSALALAAHRALSTGQTGEEGERGM